MTHCKTSLTSSRWHSSTKSKCVCWGTSTLSLATPYPSDAHIITPICTFVSSPQLLDAAAVRPSVAPMPTWGSILAPGCGCSVPGCHKAWHTGDVGQPTCRGCTRPEHVVLTPRMLEAVLQFEIAAGVDCGEPGDPGSDHLPIVMHLPRVLAQANNFHRCSAACPPRSVVLRWRPEQAAACLQGCPELHSQLYQACDEPGEAGAGFLLAFMMECAARHDSVRDGRWCPDARCPLAISPTRCAAAGIRRTQRAIDHVCWARVLQLTRFVWILVSQPCRSLTSVH